MMAWVAILAVLLLPGPDPESGAVVPAASSAGSLDAGAFEGMEPAGFASISSMRADMDRSAGIAHFEGDAVVDYGADCRLCADSIFVFFTPSNGLDRVVASGNVAVTNGARHGSCASAVFRRGPGQIELHGGDDGSLARLANGPSDEVAGRVVKFWLGEEQVEVLGSEVKIGRGKDMKGALGL